MPHYHHRHHHRHHQHQEHHQHQQEEGLYHDEAPLSDPHEAGTKHAPIQRWTREIGDVWQRMTSPCFFGTPAPERATRIRVRVRVTPQGQGPGPPNTRLLCDYIHTSYSTGRNTKVILGSLRWSGVD